MSSAMSRISVEASVATTTNSQQSSRNASRASGAAKGENATYNSRLTQNVEVKEENVLSKFSPEEKNGRT